MSSPVTFTYTHTNATVREGFLFHPPIFKTRGCGKRAAAPLVSTQDRGQNARTPATASLLRPRMVRAVPIHRKCCMPPRLPDGSALLQTVPRIDRIVRISGSGTGQTGSAFYGFLSLWTGGSRCKSTAPTSLGRTATLSRALICGALMWPKHLSELSNLRTATTSSYGNWIGRWDGQGTGRAR